LLYQPKV